MGDREIPQEGVPKSAALVRDFVNTLDHELGTDALATGAGLTAFLTDNGLLRGAGPRRRGPAVDGSQPARRPARGSGAQPRGGARHPAGRSTTPGPALRSAWPGTARVWSHDRRRTGSAGALARIGLAAHETMAAQEWWRLKICAFDECEWAYYDQSKNRSRSYCEYGCGNKLKTRAYRARQRSASSAT